MILMRTTRRSRFFVILVHLLGVSYPPLPLPQLDHNNGSAEDVSTTTAAASSRQQQKHRDLDQHISQTTTTTTTNRRRHREGPSRHYQYYASPLLGPVAAMERAHWTSSSVVSLSGTTTTIPEPPPHRPTTSNADSVLDDVVVGASSSPRTYSISSSTTTSPQQQHQQIDDEDKWALLRSSPVWLQDNYDGMCLSPMGTFCECGDAALWYIDRHYQPSSRNNSNKVQLLSSGWGGAVGSLLGGGHHQQPSRKTRQQSSSHASEYTYSFQVAELDGQHDNMWSEPEQQQRHRKRRQSRRQQRREEKRLRQQREQQQRTAECLNVVRINRNNNNDDTKEPSTHNNNNGTTTLLTSSLIHTSLCYQQNNPRRRRHPQLLFWKKPHYRISSTAVWTVREDGTLQSAASRSQSRQQRPLIAAPSSAMCLVRDRETNQARLGRCNHDDDTGSDTGHQNTTIQQVQFTFFRYRPIVVSTAVRNDATPATGTMRRRDGDSNNGAHLSDEADEEGSISIMSHQSKSALAMDHRRSGPAMHPELKLPSQLLFDFNNRKNPSKDDIRDKLRIGSALFDANPILLVGRKGARQHLTKMKVPPLTPSLTDEQSKEDTMASKMRRLQTHRYLNEAKNEIWTDPQTGLQYYTDLCDYLGRDRNEYGRHTLTGMGIYRKGYVIKVYGIAYYVSKRDVLVDPSLEKFATLTSEQLRARPDFYEILRKMGNPDTGRERLFDRTILLKTNMQLSAETMRSSLQADWSYLTEEAKGLLVGVSMNARPADEEMLALIQSPDNPSRCSCSQTAPPEYEANPECCARGTELVFTWTKANELEVRLNGRLMEIFPRPDIAEGIFYEYLRYDNPISPELLDRVVDGFPFLLGPRAQVRGVNIGHATSSKDGDSSTTSHSRAMFDTLVSWKDAFVTQMTDMTEAAKQSVVEASEQAGNTARAFALAAKEMAMEADRRRDLMMKHAAEAHVTLSKLLARDEETLASFSKWMAGEVDEPEIIPEVDESIYPSIQRVPLERFFGYPLPRWLGDEYYAPDEIGPMRIHPTINRIVLTLVHLYLLLLFIVSFPGSYSTRTKLVAVSRKSHYSGHDMSDDSESDISEETSRRCIQTVYGTLQTQDSTINNSQIHAGNNVSLNNGEHSLSRRFFNISRAARAPLHAKDNTGDPVTQVDRPETGFKKKSLSYFL